MFNAFRGLLAVVAAVFLISVSPAFGQEGSLEPYSGTEGVVENRVQGNDAGAVAGQASGGPSSLAAGETAANAEGDGNLPFTGLDLGLLAGGGAVLLLVGLGIRRLAHQSS